MTEDNLIVVKNNILNLFSDMNETDLNQIEKWISSQSYKKDLEKKKDFLKSERLLVKIGDTLKKLVPFEAEMSSEKIVPPTVGDQADCNLVNTCHVDEFLYDQDKVDKLVKCGKLKRHYCIDCNSRNVKDLIYISHSMSRQALLYVFKFLLPDNLDGKQILDVGSRLGVILYGAYYLTNASTIMGIEMNKECCEVQEKIVTKFSFDAKRIKIIHSDVMDRPDIVENSDVIVSNVLDFFVDLDKHKEIWRFYKKHVRKGCYLVFNRSFAETMDYLDMVEEFMDWLTICKPNQMENEVFFDLDECSEIFLYQVN